MARCNHCKHVSYDYTETGYGCIADPYCSIVDDEIFNSIFEGKNDCDYFINDFKTYSCDKCEHFECQPCKDDLADETYGCDLGKRSDLSVCIDYEDIDGWKPTGYCPVCGSTNIEISDDKEPYARGKGPVVKVCCNNCNHDSKLVIREVEEQHGHCPVCNKRTCLILGRYYCSECKLIFEDPETSRVML